MRDYLLSSNIDSRDIFLDHAGFNTYDSIYRAKYIFEAKKVVIITQKYHMYRALYLANELDLDAGRMNLISVLRKISKEDTSNPVLKRKKFK